MTTRAGPQADRSERLDVNLQNKTHINVDALLQLTNSVPRLVHAVRLLGTGSQPGNMAIDVRGQGMSFVESRPWIAGDDRRRLDWRVTARTQKPHTKVFDTERNQTWWLIVDGRSCMAFGTRQRFKSVQAARAAMLLAATAHAHRHSVGLVILTHGQPSVLMPAQSHAQLVKVAHQLSTATVNALQPEQDHDAPAPANLERLAARVNDCANVFVLSDFAGWQDAHYQALHRWRLNNDTRAIRLTDPLQHELLPNGRYAIHDGLHRLQIVIKKEAHALSFRNTMTAQENAIDARLSKLTIATQSLSTADDLHNMLAVLARTLTEHPHHGRSVDTA